MSKDDRKTFGYRLKETIKRAGLTQKQVSEQLQISQDTVTNYVKGTTRPRVEILIELANLLDVDVEWLISGEEPQQKEQPAKRDLLFAARMATLLKLRGLKPADLKPFGIDSKVVEDCLHGYIPDAVALCRIASTLGTTVEWLITGREFSGPLRPGGPAANPELVSLIAAMAAMDKDELKEYLKGEMPADRVMEKVSQLADLPVPVIAPYFYGSAINSNEEAATRDFPEDIYMLLNLLPEIKEEQRKELLAQATHFYGENVAPGKSSSYEQDRKIPPAEPDFRQAEGFF